MNKITKIEHCSLDELFSSLREVTLLNDPRLKVYEKCSIQYLEMDTIDMDPSQLYVLKENIESLQELEWQLKEEGFNLFFLNGYIKVTFEGVEKPVWILPPIVEEHQEANKKWFNVICDGHHRIFLANRKHTHIGVVYIKDCPIPYYAYPNPNGWKDVSILNKENKGFIKKFHRIKDNKSLYRNFVPVFGNLSVPRGDL